MNLDIKKLSMDILRDLYAGSRRLSLYPLGHPITQETLKKPLNSLNLIHSIKLSFSLEIFKDRLLAEGIPLEETVYVSGLSLDMKKHGMKNFTIYSQINPDDLYHFLSFLASKPDMHENGAEIFLSSKKIKSIKVNSDNLPTLFSFQNTYISDSGDQFLLDNRIKSFLAKFPRILPDYYLGRLKTDNDIFSVVKTDLRIEFVARIIKETLLGMNREEAMKLLEDVVLSTNWLDDNMDKSIFLGLKKLFSDYLSSRPDQDMLSSIHQLFKKVGAPANIMEQIFDYSSILKLKTFSETESIVKTLKYNDPSHVDSTALKKTIFKLATAGQTTYMQDLLEQLINSLSSSTIHLRQKALHLVITAGEVLSNGGFFDDYNFLCRESVRLSLSPTNTLEPVELASDLAWIALKKGRWSELKSLCHTLQGIRNDKKQDKNKRELAGKKLTDISESQVLMNKMVELLENDWSDESNRFFECLTYLSSRDIIQLLADKITHKNKDIRSRVIKLLVNMKRNSSEILTQILAEKIKTTQGGNVTEDEWYFYRNIFRVLKETKAEEALPYLEIISTWPNTRLKLEIIKTLEGIPPQSSAKLLDLLAADPSIEIKKAAIIGMGLSGHSEMVPRLREIFKKDPESRPTVISSLARIGGPQSRITLIEFLENEELLKSLKLPKKESEDLKIAVLKALSEIGDEAAMNKIAEISDKNANVSLFKKDIISLASKSFTNK